MISELNGCLKGKMLILEALTFTIEQKKIEEKLEAAIETNWKIKEKMKKLEKRIEEEKGILQQSKMDLDLCLCRYRR